MSRRLILAAAALVLTGGCNSTNQSKTSNRPPATAPAVTQAPSTQPDAPPIKDTDALAGTIAAHAQAIQQHLDRRAHKTPAPTSTQPAPETRIEWLEPQDYRLDLMPPQDPEGPSPVPAEPETPVSAVATSTPTPATQPAVQPAVARPQPVVTSDRLEQELARRIKEDPTDLSGQLDYQLLQLLRGHPVPQMDAIASLPTEDQEVLAAVMDALRLFRTHAASDSNMLLSRKVRPLIDLSERLRPQTNLRVATVSLCTKVQGYGIYDPIDATRLPAARDNEVIIYCEIDNFSSRLNDRGFWETNLSLDAALYNERGQRVWSDKRQTVADVSRNRRRDFFLPRKVRLPALPPGQYSLTVTIADQQANRMDEATLAIQTVIDGDR